MPTTEQINIIIRPRQLASVDEIDWEAWGELELGDGRGGFDGNNDGPPLEESGPGRMSDGAFCGALAGLSVGATVGIMGSLELNKSMAQEQYDNQLAAVPGSAPAIEFGVLGRPPGEKAELGGFAIGSILVLTVAGMAIGKYLEQGYDKYFGKQTET